jgi:hypothetical protein
MNDWALVGGELYGCSQRSKRKGILALFVLIGPVTGLEDGSLLSQKAWNYINV